MSPPAVDAPSSPAPAPVPVGGPSRPRGRALLLGAVFLTGATSLAYEIAWTRGLVLVLGSTTASAAVVLAAFVGALGLGARWGGPLADRHPRPLLLYGLLEIGAALWAVLALEVAALLLGPYATVARTLPDLVRFSLRVAIAAAVVMPGAFLLGATLPALVRFWVREPGTAGRSTAWLYGTNTLGAVAGALVTGFFGIELLGVRGWLAAAAAVALAVGVGASALGAGVARRLGPATPPPPLAAGRLPLAPALVAAALCGAVGLGAEVAGFRMLVFFVEGFTATFAAMLGVFILGLGLGSLLLGPWLARRRRPDVALGLLLVAAGFAVGLGLWVVLPGLEGFVGDVRAGAYAGAADEPGVQAALRRTALVGSAALLGLPALLLGATFPLSVRWAELAGLAPGRAVGRVYLYNSLGTLAAPFLVGFVLVPLLGVPDAWRLLGLVCVLGGVCLAVHVDGTRHRPRLRRAAWTLAALLFAATAVLPAALHPGAGSSARLVRASHVLHGRPDRTLLAVETDETTTASVVETRGGERILYTDDFAAAATGRHYRYMRMLGHLPVLLARDPAHAMVIAFGTGTTAGAVARHDEVDRLEVVEVSGAVYDLAGYFEEANRGVLADPRVEVIRDDGRNALLLHDADLDVITLEPLMPYAPAGLPFYTKEFYELARDRLRDGGVLCQWVPVHAMPAGLYAALVETFFEVFPDGSLWFFEQSSALIGTKGDLAIDRPTFERRVGAVTDDLRAAGLATPDLVLSAYVASGRRVLSAAATRTPPLAWAGRVVRDLDPFPEFHPTPRASLNTTYLKDTLAYLWSVVSRDDPPPFVAAGSNEAERLREGTVLGLRGRAAEAFAAWARVGGEPLDTVLQLLRLAEVEYGRALERLPGERVLTWRRARVARQIARWEVADLLGRARRARAGGRESEARDHVRAARGVAEAAARIDDGDAIASERADAFVLEAAVLLHEARCRRARRVLLEGRDGLSPGVSDRALLDAALRTLEAHVRGEAPAEHPRITPWLRDLPPCAPEGLDALSGVLADFESTWADGTVRALRLAADDLAERAPEEDVAVEAARRLRGLPPSDDPERRAVRSVLLSTLAPGDPELAALLADERPAACAAALREAGRRGLLHRHAALGTRTAASEHPEVRVALADGAGADGARSLLLLVVDLLLDREREVRAAAAAALFRHHPDLMGLYDPDAPEPERRDVADRVRQRIN